MTMANNKETGHAKNLANFEREVLLALEAKKNYNPFKSILFTDELQAKLQRCKAANDALKAAEPLFIKAQKDRKDLYGKLQSTMLRFTAIIKIIDTTESMKESLHSIINKIKGRRVSNRIKDTEMKEGEEKVNQISAAQTGFDNRLENFDKFIQRLATIQSYKPNEREHSIEGLLELKQQILQANNNVSQTYAALTNARIARNQEFYAPTDGLVTIGNEVKAYMLSVYGRNSQNYKQFAAIKFTKPAGNFSNVIAH